MSPETQAAITAAHAAVDTARATWALFWATASLCALTIGAVVAGVRAANSATEAYRLEAEPVLVVTAPGTDLGPPLLPVTVVTGEPSLAEGLTLRSWRPSDEPPRVQGAYIKPRWKSITLRIENAGRSPALDIAIDIDVERPVMVKPGHEYVGFEQTAQDGDDASTGLGHFKRGVQRGRGRITVPAIAPQAKVFVKVENHLGVQVRITPARNGSQIHPTKDCRRPIRVVTPASSFLVSASE